MQQPRSQPSQQSFSQGISSQQNGIFSQISQSSIDDVLTDNQRFGSQEKDNSVKRLSCLAPISYPWEESQMPISRSSSSLTHRWSSATASENKCQLNDELEHKITMMETSLNRSGMILDSVQAYILQVNKGTKEQKSSLLKWKAYARSPLLIKIPSICWYNYLSLSSLAVLIAQQNIIFMTKYYGQNRAQEETRASLESISNHLRTIMQQDKIQEILLTVLSLREQINTNYQKQNDELSKCLSGDLQEIMCSLKTLKPNNMPLSILPPKVTGASSSSQKPFIMRKFGESTKVSNRHILSLRQKWEAGQLLKRRKRLSQIDVKSHCKNPKQRRASLDREQKVFIELDDETDDDFSCLIIEKKTGHF
ncbi:hypothetical protein BVRB_1g004630 [Beta vulgaris subsp. vulgaris]|nr:hypothetical protein BVRB_1g004630 [Beta vulgaris subsp. vulgaris]